MIQRAFVPACLLWLAVIGARGAETLPALENGRAPQTFEAMWAGFDPRGEPLETEVLKQWEEEGVVLRVVRYRIGVFKGQKAIMAGVYGFPKGATKLPGLLQIHGGGQYADYRAPLTNARRGYATLSIAWAGRIAAPQYQVGSETVALFWRNATSDPNYKLTTDWGRLDAYHAPCRNPQNQFHAVVASPWTLDTVESPRNNSWFLCALGARRGLTFLEQQPEVDAARLGVYGHSMGGKLTVMTTAADRRVRVAVPSCGGISDRPTDNALYAATIADGVSLRQITCPIALLSPANDFHGRYNDLPRALREIRSQEWRIACSAHHNHQDAGEFETVGQLWFDRHLKGGMALPRTPAATLELGTSDGVPVLTVRPDASRPTVAVDVYYTQQGRDEAKYDHENTIAQHWRWAATRRNGESWTASLPLLDTNRPLWAYANVTYPLDTPVEAVGYYYGPYRAEQFVLSSAPCMVDAPALRAAGVQPTDRPSLLIESFGSDWQHEWFTYDRTGHWMRRTHKVYDPKWQAPAGAKLVLEVRSQQPNRLVVGLDDAAAECTLTGGNTWQRLTLAPGDFRDAAGKARTDWKGLRELRLIDRENLVGRKRDAAAPRRTVGAAWQGAPPEFRDLRWATGADGH